MLSLFHLSMSEIVSCLMENLENVTDRLQVLIEEEFPQVHCYNSALVSAVLKKIYSLIPPRPQDWPLAQQREMIPLLKFCIKTNKVFCWYAFGDIESEYYDATMSDIMRRLNFEILSALFNIIYEDYEMELSVLHYSGSRVQSTQLFQLIERNANRLLSLHLAIYVVPRCSLFNLRELFLGATKFEHIPTELTNIPNLTTLVLVNVRGIPDNLYKQLACNLTFPKLENICIDNGEGLEFALGHCNCSCSETCLLNLTWLGQVNLFKRSHVTSRVLTCLGVNRRHHDTIMNIQNTAQFDPITIRCSIKGNFNIVRQVYADIRLFPYFSLPHVKQVRLHGLSFSDGNINVIREMLASIVCEELVIDRSHLLTTNMGNMLENVNTLANLSVRCSYFNTEESLSKIKELRNLYPTIRFKIID